MKLFSKTRLGAVLAVTFSLPAAAWSQDYPTKPIRLVTSSPGGAGDFVTRTLAQAISGPLGQPVIVDNRGAGILGMEMVAHSPADGYALLVTSNVFWLLPLMQKVSYDPVKDFTPITLLVTSPNIVVCHPSLPAKNIRELIALARSQPGKLNFAGGSVGSASHLAGELFKYTAKLNMQYVPYKGAGPALTDTVAGHVHLLFSNLSAAGAQIKSGRLRALGITSAKPSPLAPELATVASQGLPGYESEAIYGVFGPAGTPIATVQRINQESVRALQRAEVRERFTSAGSQIVAGSGTDLGNRIASEVKRMGKVITDAKIKME